MKKIILLVMMFVMSASMAAVTAMAASATFSWLPNVETDLAGYKIHYGAVCGEYDTAVDVGLPALKDGRVYYTVEDIPDVATCYAATAHDTQGVESDYSEVVNHNAPPAAPGGFAGVTVNVTVTVN